VGVLEKVPPYELDLVLHAIHGGVVAQHGHARLVNLNRHAPRTVQGKLRADRQTPKQPGHQL
jgi:hypothetical protein